MIRDTLMAFGEAGFGQPSRWPDYLSACGVSENHIPELIGIIQDDALNGGVVPGNAEWAPVHAWRALGQLRAEGAIDALLQHLRLAEDDDYASEEIPMVLGMIGPAAIAPLTAFALDRSLPALEASCGARGIREVGERFPDSRDECVGVLTHLLKTRREPEFRGFLVCDLIGLRAVETIGTIRALFSLNAIDISIPGDCEDVEIAMGLRAERATPQPRYNLLGNRDELEAAPLRSVKIGRNDPCPCGSGKKYKKCCLV